jgi:hypothetical protein
MQMIIMAFRSSLEGEVLKCLEEERVFFSFVEKVQGQGATGKAPSSLYWGGTNTMLYAGIHDEQLSVFRDRLHKLQQKLQEHSTVPVPFHVFVLPCIQWF